MALGRLQGFLNHGGIGWNGGMEECLLIYIYFCVHQNRSVKNLEYCVIEKILIFFSIGFPKIHFCLSLHLDILTHPYLCLFGQWLTVLVYFQFGKLIMHWICSFFSIYSVFSNLWCFIPSDGEASTPTYFVPTSDGVLNSSFWTPVPWDSHLNFCSEMIKRNLERHNWRRMCEKHSKAFVDFWVVFDIYMYHHCRKMVSRCFDIYAILG